MFYSSLLALHVLTVVIWVGGMFFAYNALRPAAAEVFRTTPQTKAMGSNIQTLFPLGLVIGCCYFNYWFRHDDVIT